MGEYHCGCGKTWEEAKTALLKKVEEFLSIEVPPPETVEIDVKQEEEELNPLPI
jgi:hypothetical protein